MKDLIRVPAVAISLKQPWADRILFDGKDIENRTWRLPSSYWNVPVALHASKTHDRDVMTKRLAEDRYGCLVGSVTFGEPVTDSESPWFFGPVGWPVVEAVAFAKPIPAKGALGVWKVPFGIALTEVARSRW